MNPNGIKPIRPIEDPIEFIHQAVSAISPRKRLHHIHLEGDSWPMTKRIVNFFFKQLQYYASISGVAHDGLSVDHERVIQ